MRGIDNDDVLVSSHVRERDGCRILVVLAERD